MDNRYDDLIKDTKDFYHNYYEFIEIKPKLIESFKNRLVYEDDLKDIIIEDPKLTLSIVKRYKKIIIKNKEAKEIVDNLNTDIKKKYKRFDDIIIKYLDIIEPTFTPNLSWCRPNQELSIKKSLDNNFMSGIDLHATGGGKTFIILAKAYYYNKIFNKNIVLLCEKKYILNNEFANLSLINKDIIDIDKMNIINLSVTQDKNFYNKIKGNNNLIICNRSYMSSNSRYRQLNESHNIGLILIDECHSSSATVTFEILEYFKSLNCELIGFSATPIRNNNLSKYIKLFGYDNKINYLYNYSLFNAIIDYDSSMQNPYGCLPFKIYLYDNIDKTPEKLYAIINEFLPKLHYKKIIVWFNKIDICDDFYEYFTDKPINNIKLFKSHNKTETNDNEYMKTNNNCIMFCVNRFREGTNLNTLELGFLLDANITRGDIPTIQMCGRLVRFDNEGIKKYGEIIDFCSKSNILEKIIKYYMDLTNDTQFNKIIDFIKSNIQVIKDKKQINIRLTDTKQIELIFRSFEIDWKNIKNELIEYVTNHFKYMIYRVPIGKLSLANFYKTIKKLENPIWGCREELVKKIKVNDKLIFEIDELIEIYNITEIKNDPNKGLELWNDSQYSKILYLEFINSYDSKSRYVYLNKLIGYKEKFVPRTITPITNFTDGFTYWFESLLN
jgi:superfamily II DNA or RNA helicase